MCVYPVLKSSNDVRTIDFEHLYVQKFQFDHYTWLDANHTATVVIICHFACSLMNAFA